MIWDVIVEGVFKTLDKILPDPTERAAAKLRLLELEQSGQLAELKAETDLALQQIQVNLVEATSSDPYVSRWRPSFGWIGVVALGYTYLVQPLLPWIVRNLFDSSVDDLPMVSTAELWPLILGMLGLSASRSYDKKNGVAS